MQKHTFNQILSSITACLALCHMGLWFGYVSVIVLKFQNEGAPIAMTSDIVSWIFVILDTGCAISPFPAGYLMNRFGRLTVLKLAFTLFLLGSLIIYFVTSPFQMYLASLLIGFGVGIACTTPILYVAEIAKPKIRGALGSIGGVMYSGGIAITMTVGPFLSFQTLTSALLFCPAIGLLLTFFIVESPYYHFIRNNEGRASKSLSQIRNSTKTSENDVELESIRKTVDDNLKGSGNFLELIARKSNRRALIIVVALSMMRTSCGYNILFFFASKSLPANAFWDPKITMSIFAWLNVIFSFLGLGLVDRFGRKPLLMISLVGFCSLNVVLAIFYYFSQKTSVDVSQFVFVPHVCVLLGGIFFPMGIGLISQIYRGELLPVSIKGPGSAIATIVQSVMSTVSNKTYFAAYNSIGVYLAYIIFFAVNFFSALFTIICIFETKGKTLEEIQKLLDR